jgi:dienelactone hydrolase
MRKGRGASEGTYSESYGCDHGSVSSGVASAIEDLDGVFDFLLSQPYVDTYNILLSGISRGGYLSVIYAGKGKHRSDVKGVINFVGGWMGEKCGTDLNSPGYAQTGKATKLAMLWLYSEGDSYYSPIAIRGYLDAFTKAGGKAKFTLYNNVPGNGHRLANFISIWKEEADQYLDSINFGNR